MKWYREEDSRIIKAWGDSAEMKAVADKTVALSPNKSFLIATAFGVIGRGHVNAIHYDNFSQTLSDYIDKKGWSEIPFNEISDIFQKVSDELVANSGEFFSEFEIIFIKNDKRIFDEVKRQEKKPNLIPS